MTFRIFKSNYLELVGQTLMLLNIRYANSVHQHYSLQNKLKLFVKLTYSKTPTREGAF